MYVDSRPPRHRTGAFLCLVAVDCRRSNIQGGRGDHAGRQRHRHAGGVAAVTGTFWVLRGQVEAFLSNQTTNAVLVGALQQFRGGAVTNIVPSQMAQILQGLSTAGMPLTKGGDEQARETAAMAGFELARSVSGAAIAAAVQTNVVSLARVPTPSTVPILPGNQQLQPSSPVVAAPPPPPPPPHECYGYSWRSGSSGGASGVATRAAWRSPTRTRYAARAPAVPPGQRDPGV